MAKEGEQFDLFPEETPSDPAKGSIKERLQSLYRELDRMAGEDEAKRKKFTIDRARGAGKRL